MRMRLPAQVLPIALVAALLCGQTLAYSHHHDGNLDAGAPCGICLLAQHMAAALPASVPQLSVSIAHPPLAASPLPARRVPALTAFQPRAPPVFLL